MTEPQPEMVNGDPMCRPSCPRHGLNGGGCWQGVLYCPLVLRTQRDAWMNDAIRDAHLLTVAHEKEFKLEDALAAALEMKK